MTKKDKNEEQGLKLYTNTRVETAKTTCLMQCCEKGDESFEEAREILKNPKFVITIQDNRAWNLLHMTCYSGLSKITELVLEHDEVSKILNAKNCDQRTPLDQIVWKIGYGGGSIKHIIVWNRLVLKGAMLSFEKEMYKKIKSDDYKEPSSSLIEAIQANPPKDMRKSDSTLIRQEEVMVGNTNKQGDDFQGYNVRGWNTGYTKYRDTSFRDNNEGWNFVYTKHVCKGTKIGFNG